MITSTAPTITPRSLTAHPMLMREVMIEEA